MKICKNCELLKEDSEFYKRLNICKPCHSIRCKEYYKNNNEKIKNNVKKYKFHI